MDLYFIVGAAVSLLLGGNFLIIGKTIEEFTYDFSKTEAIFKILAFVLLILGYLLSLIGFVMILLS